MRTQFAPPALYTDLAAQSGRPGPEPENGDRPGPEPENNIGTAPEWVQLLPPGPVIAARDGRSWRYEPQTILSAFAANRGPLAIDYEHGQDHLAEKGQKAPAAGWITAMEERGGGIWGRVEWTGTAAREIAERAYRFLSPSMRHTRDGVLTRLIGAGLVNRPALEMTALSRQDPNPEKDDFMDLTAIARAMGLADTADEAAILAAIATRNDERTALCSALAVPADADTKTLCAALAKLVEDHTSALARQQDPDEVEELRTALASLRDERQVEKIDKALDAAQAAGKITPASRADYLAMCQVEGGLGRFESLVKSLPVIGAPSRIGKDVPTTETMDEQDPVALAARARKYQDEQAALGIVISTTYAVQHVRDSQ